MFRVVLLLALCSCTMGQRTYLRADGIAHETYSLFNRVLGPSSYEVPDCGHAMQHITQQIDRELLVPVFVFYSHRNLDNDRCINFDRVRAEIKTHRPSPPSMVGFRGDYVSYSWDMRIDEGLQPSIAWTHFYQIKYLDGPEMQPAITISAALTNPSARNVYEQTKNF